MRWVVAWRTQCPKCTITRGGVGDTPYGPFLPRTTSAAASDARPLFFPPVAFPPLDHHVFPLHSALAHPPLLPAQVQNNPRAKTAARKVQRAFRNARVRRAQPSLTDRHTNSSRRTGAADGAAVVKICDGPPPMDFGDISELVFSTADRSSGWYRARKRWGRRRLRLIGAVAAYGDLVSATLVFPAMLFGFAYFSIVAGRD
eukprot:scaffold10590_cov81-Isochrysis_galbana.AAC.2